MENQYKQRIDIHRIYKLSITLTVSYKQYPIDSFSKKIFFRCLRRLSPICTGVLETGTMANSEDPDAYCCILSFATLKRAFIVRNATQFRNAESTKWAITYLFYQYVWENPSLNGVRSMP